MHTINTNHAPAAIGPYAQAVHHGGLIYSSGIIGLSPDTGALVEGGIEAQTRQVLASAAAILEAGGARPVDVLKTTIYLTDLADFAVVNGIYAEFFGEHRPARATVQVVALPKGALLELDFIAAARG